ncbi:uncharacterized protein RJT20DRAFT_60301 [Scheffersomyces xylosifermentans]|uniref:uncharacterized protein n=1 Tax=Scheffersomyces xylosifermentans TaxID=1304137 RepID=UPI00315D27C7
MQQNSTSGTLHEKPPASASSNAAGVAEARSNSDKEKLGSKFHQHQQAHHHHQFPLGGATSIFPSSSLRDIISLVFILLSLPQSVSLCLLIVYILSGANFMGGKFIVNFLLRENSEPVSFNYKRIGYSFVKILGVNLAIFYVLSSVVLKKSYFNYVVILSKSIISSDLIGSSSINYITSISHKRITTKIQYDDNKRFINNSLINSVVCFIIINYIHYLINWLNVSFKFITVYGSNIGYINSYTFNQIGTKLYLVLSLHVINSMLFKKATILQSSIPNVTEDISINCDDNKLLDVDLKDSITNSSPIKRYSRNLIESNSIAVKNFENFIVSPFNSKLTILKNKLRSNTNTAGSTFAAAAVDNPNSFVLSKASPPPTTTSTTTTSSSSTTSTSLTTTTVSPTATTIENTIIIQPFWSILAASKAILKNPLLFNGEPTKCKNNGGEFINLFESTNSAVSGKKFAKTYDKSMGSLRMAIILNDDSKIVLKVLDASEVTRFDLSNLKIRLNNVGWSYFKIIKAASIDDEESEGIYLIIYGLTSLFQYEIDLIYENSILNHFLINTTKDDDKVVLNKSLPETSSLTTLQISLISTIKNVSALRAKFKKFKKDENRKLTDLKNNIDNLKNKISKYNNKQVSDTRVFGKLKGLKHSVIQLENEIEQSQKDIKDLTAQEAIVKKEFQEEERKQLRQLQELENVLAQYEERMKAEKLKLKAAKSESSAIALKHQKLLNKQQFRQEEIKALQNELKNIKKNEILNKFSRRIKRTNDKFETILPKVMHEIEVLRRECNSLLNA